MRNGDLLTLETPPQHRVFRQWYVGDLTATAAELAGAQSPTGLDSDSLLPALKGRYNFDVIRYEYYRDRTAAFEAFKKGDMTVRQEFTSRIWARDYNFPALQRGEVIKEELPEVTEVLDTTDHASGEVLMLGYMNREALRSTLVFLPAAFFEEVNVTSSRRDVPRADPTVTMTVVPSSELLASAAVTPPMAALPWSRSMNLSRP